ncbi:MAG: class I SAM-dependent methyltransferase [Bacteroidota bacterium]
MEKALLIFRYVKYRFAARSRYRIHSQFVYNFINDILRDKKRYDDFDLLWKHRNKLATSNNPIETVDFGVGSGKKAYSTTIISLGRIVRLRSHKEKELELLYRLVKHYQPENILEFGTAAGISTSYIKSANPASYMVTMEGCANLASKANESFIELGINNIETAVGNFDTNLDNILSKFSTLDFVFFDGNHRKEPTLTYFEKCTQLSNENSIFVFDDIHWSAGMESAWETIKRDPRVSITIDLFWFGIVFFRKGIEKQDFILHY